MTNDSSAGDNAMTSSSSTPATKEMSVEQVAQNIKKIVRRIKEKSRLG